MMMCPVSKSRIWLVAVLILAFASGFSTVAPAQTTAPDLPVLAVRTGDHETFSRVVFDWNHKVHYTSRIEGHNENTRLIITFSEAAKPRFDGISTYPLQFISNPRVTDKNANLAVAFSVPESARIRDFVDGTRVVFDVMPPSLPASESDIEPASGMAPASRDQPTSQVAEDPEKKKTVISDREVKKPEAGPTVPSPVAANTVVVKTKLLTSGLRLEYTLPETVPAAVFLRDGYLWAIFDQPSLNFDHRNVDMQIGGRLKNAEQIPDDGASIIRYGVRAGQSVSVRRKGTQWQIDLKDTISSPVFPIESGLQTSKSGADRIFLPVTDVGSRIEFIDPGVGDHLIAVPVLDPGRGVQKERQFIQFNILDTAQGVVVQLKADDISVNRYRNGVVIDSMRGLVLSKSKLSQSFQTKPDEFLEDDDTDNVKLEAPKNQVRLIDLAAWRQGPRDHYTDNLHKLQVRLSMASADDRNAARWDLARFYLGFGMGPDAIGVLKLMAETDPSLSQNAEYRAILGVAHIQAGRYQKATKDLDQDDLADNPDAALWRAVALEKLEKWEPALSNYMKGADVLSLYDESERAKFQLAAIRAAYHKGNAEFMSRELDILASYKLPPLQATEIDYLKGRMYELAGDAASAMTNYKKVIDAHQRRTSALAQLALTDLQLEDSLISVTDAIDRLERLRFAWRGDQFELDLLDRLGRLYFQAEDYRTGFETLRQAVTYFGKSPKTRALSQLMEKVFKGLFLDGGADSMPPVSALALYYDFRELTPLGAEGDQMIRRLSDRLVSVDLLDRAAELLEHQVKYRLEGVARSTVAIRLAMIYLMDSKPNKALETIRSTRQAVIPDDIAEHRRKVEARALTGLKRYEEALVLLEGDKSHSADLLRADIYWGAGDWKNVVALGRRLLKNRWQDTAPLSSDDRRQVLRMALAMSLSDDRSGLDTLRGHYLTAMAGGTYANAFNVITGHRQKTGDELQALTRDIAGVNTLESFMTNYRKEFADSH